MGVDKQRKGTYYIGDMNEIQKILNSNDLSKIKAVFLFNKNQDIELIRKKFNYWSKYFIPHYFTSKDADFHKLIDEGNIGVYKNGESFLDIAFRGSSKTTRTKLFIAFAIANDEGHYRKYIKVLSKDGKNSRQITTDVYNILISRRVKALYPEIFEKTETKREETMASFTTATGVKMTADTVGTDQRGDIQDESRPDLIYFDDFETSLSLMSAQITHKIWENMEEAKNGLAKEGGIIYNCNYISERGNVHKLVQKIKNQIIIPIEENGAPTWDRYTIADIQKIKRDTENYEGEYLGKPSASKDVYFDRESVDKQVPKQFIDEVAGLKIFRKYDPMNRVSSGHDVGGGVGLDSSTSVFLDLDVFPVQVIGTYKNNEIKPDVFAHEIARQCKRFGENYAAVEKNYGSTLDILKTIYPTDMIHKTQRQAMVLYKVPVEFGFDTNNATKPAMMADLAKAIEDGLIELNDPDLIAEARSYTLGDLMDKEVDPRITTRHFDMLMSCAIAWVVRSFVPKKIPKEDILDEWYRKRAQNAPKTKVNPAR